jgi:hypothetical protein
MKLAVFGHYDSRGGTTAIGLPEHPTEADVWAAIERYDREVFDIQPTGEIGTTAYGMEARECDKQVHWMMYRDSSPGIEDFMFVAELHGADEVEDGTDLDSDGRRVLIDASTEPTNRPLEVWSKKMMADLEHLKGQEWLDAHNERCKSRPPEFDAATLIDLTLNKPVQLEAVKVPDGFDSDLDLLAESIRARAAAENVWVGGCDSRWTEAQAAAAKRFEAEDDELEVERKERIKLMAFTLKGPNVEVRRWDDDAFGFLLME